MENSIEQRLVSLGDAQYRDFTCKLIPMLNPSSIVGVRVGDLRALAASLKNTPQAEAFLRALPHRLYEENNLHGLLISQFKEYDASVRALDEFLPYVDNWATCDLIRPAAWIRGYTTKPYKKRSKAAGSPPSKKRFCARCAAGRRPFLPAFFMPAPCGGRPAPLPAGRLFLIYYAHIYANKLNNIFYSKISQYRWNKNSKNEVLGLNK